MEQQLHAHVVGEMDQLIDTGVGQVRHIDQQMLVAKQALFAGLLLPPLSSSHR